MKVLHIMSGFGGGISSFIYNKALEMKPYGVRFDVISYDDCPDYFVDAIQSTSGKVYKMFNPKTKGWRTFKRSFTLALQENDYDVIHCHIAGKRVIPYYFLAKRYTHARFYVHAHSSIIEEQLSPTEKLSVHFDQFLNRSVSQLAVGCGKKAIKSLYGKQLTKKDMMVIPNSINVDDFAYKDETKREQLRQQYRALYDIKDDEVVIGHIGRLHTVKNHEQTLKIAQAFKEQACKVSILIIGAGERQRELVEKVKTANLTDVITFTGRMSPIADLYPALDVLLLPSFSEGLPTVVVEAQVAGVPVVLSDTITDEVDLGLGMLNYEALDATVETWLKAVQLSAEKTVPAANIRAEQAEEKKFSNQASAALYVAFLNEKIRQYTL